VPLPGPPFTRTAAAAAGRAPGGLRRALVVLAIAVMAPGAALARPRVSVQPIAGAGGPQLRATVVRIVRRKGMRVTTGIPTAEGTGQYYTWAREAGVKAFVATELVTVGRRQRATILVWSGNSGSIVGRWTVAAPAGQLPRNVARGFWRHLGKAVARAQPPAEWRELPPGPTLRINAGSRHDGEIVGASVSSRSGRRPHR
jgi:hypothetical protein